MIIPSLTSEEDVPKLIGILRRSYSGVHIIVSDDGSTDGTKEAVERISRRVKNVLFLDRRGMRIHGLTARALSTRRCS